MARKPTDPKTRASRLRIAKEGFPDGAEINQGELALALGVSRNRVRAMLLADENIPCISEGREGESYRFDAHATLDYLIAKAETDAAERESRASRETAMIGLDVPASAGGGDALHLTRMVNITLRLEEDRVRQGERCPSAMVVALFNDQSRRHINGIMGVSHQIDPTNLLPNDIRELVDAEMRRLAVALKTEDERALTKFRADTERSAN